MCSRVAAKSDAVKGSSGQAEGLSLVDHDPEDHTPHAAAAEKEVRNACAGNEASDEAVSEGGGALAGDPRVGPPHLRPGR